MLICKNKSDKIITYNLYGNGSEMNLSEELKNIVLLERSNIFEEIDRLKKN